ncbi:hypothetical protein NLM33_40915 [Bradyrhizobium sp. CCGUVB1N3]|uniref:hypothetical protein n=1 Tax=Bradyrhizobium sp. CCGUVB1N3 TaxID=2949629 RepID=UPI0020B46028|nr:hypothetical protein [Bradyrhizobium sp. CCGUVB1N3]MCP3476562.1 hypothetical protein [Bradyrhizobium sp. CCGUVB1N3]
MTRDTLRGIANQFQRWVTERTEKRHIPIVEAPKGCRDKFIDPYFERTKPDAIVAILKAREPARIMTAIGDNGRKPMAPPVRAALGYLSTNWMCPTSI